jgi:succinate dehydrogenase / fumarate reductase cytochrome b subunit
MNNTQRPLSPHLSVYRWRITSGLSILHRMTGVANAIGTVLFVGWLVSIASGPDAYASMSGFIGSWLGKLLLAGWAFSFFYHLCNGIRHLFWDAGKGFEMHQARRSGLAVVTVSGLLTVATWLLVLL